MHLKILLPSHILVDQPVQKIIAEDYDGSFCLKPRHIDLITALKPGLLQFTTGQGEEIYVAVDEGVLVKCADDVSVSTYNAVTSDDLESLKDTLEHRFRQLDESERVTRSALARLEAGVVRRFIEL